MRLRLLATLLLASLSAQAQIPGFYRQPTQAGATVVFVSQGDLWRAPAAGGQAVRLTAHSAQETQPLLLPDGKTLAFVGQMQGAGDVYTMPLEGGAPQRRTWLHSAAIRLWVADAQGRLLLTAPAADGRPQSSVWRLDGDQLQALPVADASDVALSLDGSQLVFTRGGLRSDNAKGYRGGAMAQLWVMALAGNAEARPLLPGTLPRANDKRPLPYRDASGRERIAFLSDRNGFFNVHSVAADGSDLRMHSDWRDFDVRSASLVAGEAAVLVARGADLHRVSLAALSQQPAPLPISLQGDASAAVTPRWHKRPQDFLGTLALAPNGERALVGLRGRLTTQGVQGLRRSELQQPAGSRCREAAFSADSRHVFALCDFSGEVELWQLDPLGGPERRQLTQGATVLRTALAVSPEGRHIAHSDLAGALYLTDLRAEGGPRTREIDRATQPGGIGALAWHPDGQALAYTKGVGQGYRGQLWLRTLDGEAPIALTSGRFDSNEPAFSPDGQWLFFASRRHFATQAGSSVWADRNMGPAFEPGVKLYALALQTGLRAPWQPKDELPAPRPAEAKPAAAAAAKPGDKPAAAPAKPALPRIVLAGLSERLFELPVPPGRVSDLGSDGKRLWWREADGFAAGALRSVALEPAAQPETHSERVRRYALNLSGKQLLLQRDGAPGAAPEILLLDASPRLPADVSKSSVRWADGPLRISPREEWQQLFDDAWRLSRDHFYDPRLHGIDWAASRQRHAALLPRVGDRLELNELLAQQVGDLNLLHSQIATGDVPPQAEDVPAPAGLGAWLEPHAQGARVARLYRGDPELISDRGPLTQPGLDVREGDVITAINGRALRWPQGSELLQGEAGRQMRLDLLRGEGQKISVIVTPVDARREAALRYGDWRWSRAQAVERASQGRIGYLHLRAMGPEDVADFAKDFYAHSDKAALILDVRFNNGGNIDSWILEKLLRRAWAWWQPRHPGGTSYANMQNAFTGPLVVLANADTYSDGETLAEGFKRLRLGPVIGQTTHGAGVWLSDRNRLMDGGLVRAAETAQTDAEGRVLIEGVGVTPDIAVDNLPRVTAAGGDAQLDAAVAHLLAQLTAAGAPRGPKPAAYPNHRR